MIKVNNNYTCKHLILSEFFKKWQDGEDRTNGGTIVTEHGRCLSLLEIVSKTNLPKSKIDLILISLLSKDLIKILVLDSDKSQKNNKWIITELGKECHANNYFLNERGLFYRKFFVELLSLLLAVGSLIFSIWTASQNSSLEKQVEQQNQQLQQLERKLLK